MRGVAPFHHAHLGCDDMMHALLVLAEVLE